MAMILAKPDISIYTDGDKTVWIPVSSRSSRQEARALIPFNGINGSYTVGCKAAPRRGHYFEALRAVQQAWKNDTVESFSTGNGPETQRADKWRHAVSQGAPLLGPTAGWVEVPVSALERITAEEIASMLEASGQRIVSARAVGAHPDGPMFRTVSTQARTFQLEFRRGALALWGAECALSGATCLLEAAHLKSVADCKGQDPQALTDPLNSIMLNIALHALLDAGLIAFSDTGHLLISEHLSHHDRAAYGIRDTMKAAFEAGALKYVRHHREHVFRGRVTML